MERNSSAIIKHTIDVIRTMAVPAPTRFPNLPSGPAIPGPMVMSLRIPALA
jgi:hypothetical protein